MGKKTASKRPSAVPADRERNGEARRPDPPKAVPVTENTILSPSANQLIPAGNLRTVLVHCAVISGYDAVKAGCFPDAGSVDINSPNVRDFPGTGPNFTGIIPIARVGVNLNAGSANNNVVAAWARNTGTGGWERFPSDVAFKATVPASEQFLVHAQWCPWLAWADDDPANHGLTESILGNQPVPIVLPDNMSTVTFKPDSTFLWRSGSSETTNYGFDTDKVDLENEAYRKVELKSDKFELEAPFNRYSLVYLIGGDAYDSGTTYTIKFAGHNGSSAYVTTSYSAANDKKLFLAFHEGSGWTNNSGVVVVVLEWS